MNAERSITKLLGLVREAVTQLQLDGTVENVATEVRVSVHQDAVSNRIQSAMAAASGQPVQAIDDGASVHATFALRLPRATKRRQATKKTTK